MRRRDVIRNGIYLAAALLKGQARAQTPALRIIYPYAAGNGADSLIRLVADEMSRKLNRPVIVENRVGADGRIGVRDAKNAPADGNTFLFTPFGTMVLFPSYYKTLAYDPVQDFTPVSQMTTVDFALAVAPQGPVNDLSQLLQWLKGNPGKGSYGVPGIGAMPYFLPYRLATLARVDLRPVVYKGAALALTDVMGGQIPLICAPLSDLLAQHKAGAIRILAVSGSIRSEFAPDVPTFTEQGYDIQGLGWYAMYAPRGTPVSSVDAVRHVIVEWLHSDAGRARCEQLWMTPTGTTSDALARIQASDRERWAPVIRESGASAD
jgi:tripartite-type tricarboxylate transporter receptor subunit TctC